jgi:hypothetical protein
MFDSHPAAVSGSRGRPAIRSGGVAGNARLTGAVAVALLVLLAAEGITIPFIGQLLGPHLFIGLMLIPPVALKLGSVGWRFARYYTHDEPYVRKGPPPLVLRLLAPGVVLTTIALFGTGVALLVAGPPSHTLIFAHKLSFFAWVALMTLHVLGHLLELPALASADWRRGPRIGGAVTRAGAVVAALGIGVALGFVALAVGGAWL